MHPLISIQILSWNKADKTLKAIQSAMEQTYPNIEIVVVDNGSEDDSVTRIQQQFPEVTLVKLNKNYGCPVGRNKGVPHCKGEFIFYMDNDALLHRKAVEQAYRTIKKDDRIGVVGGVVFPFTDYSKADVNCTLPNGDSCYFSSLFHGGVSLHRKSMYQSTGIYPKQYFYSGEEGYLIMNMLTHDYFTVKDESVILWHIPSELSNGNATDLVNRQVNGLANRITFWPPEFVIVYILKSLVRHPYQAIRFGVFLKWVIRWPQALIKKMIFAIKTRKPLPRRTMQLYYSLSIKKNLYIDQAKWLRVSYIRSLLFELLKG
jgi:GT2 family glycosyltransferase